MRITALQQTENKRGSFFVIEYIDDNGNAQTIMRAECDESRKHVVDFINGNIDDDKLISMFSITPNLVNHCAKTVGAKLRKVSNHISTDGRHVYFDGNDMRNMRIDPVLENHLVRLILNKSEDLKGWALFTERLYMNVDPEICTQFVRWLNAQDWLTIDSTGRLVGYRGCDYDDVNNTNTPYARHHGFAIVDGIPINGRIPNRIGSIIEMPRERVTHDPSEGCASGLHVGTYEYAKDWAGRNGYILRVAVAPEDIVSVPFECDSQKIRCCKFEVLDATPKREVEFDKFHDTMNYDYNNYDDDDYEDDDDIDDYEDDEW